MMITNKMIPVAAYSGTYNILGLSCGMELCLGILRVCISDSYSSYKPYAQSIGHHLIQRLKCPQRGHSNPLCQWTLDVMLFLILEAQCLQKPPSTLCISCLCDIIGCIYIYK